MVGVVEQQPVSSLTRPVFGQCCKDIHRRPLVSDDDVGTVDGAVNIKRVRIVPFADETREGALELRQRLRPVLLDQVGVAPAPCWFEHAHAVSARQEFGHDPTEKMGIAMVPVRHQRVIEEGELHAQPLAKLVPLLRLRAYGLQPGRSVDHALSSASYSRTADLQASIRALSPWFHNFSFDGIETAPDHFLGDYPRVKWARFQAAIPADLRGASVLDIGCNGGFYSIEMKRRGADRVLGIDVDDRYLNQARLAARLSHVEIELQQMSVYEVGALRERFDVVLFMGVLYHLRHPLLALDLIREHVAKELVIVQSMLRGSREIVAPVQDAPFTDETMFEDARYPAMFFVERSYSGDPTNWWIPNASAMAGMLRAAGLALIARPEEEVFICRVADAATTTGRGNVRACALPPDSV